MDDKEESLLDRYRLPENDNDEETASWRRMLDLESPIKSESDWYSTKTFQVFLDALDINQPVSLNRSKNTSRESVARANIHAQESVPNSKDGSNIGVDLSRDTGDKQRPKTTRQGKRSNNHVETILSAEALKILSELPDLSQMSATRSFVFPNNDRDSRTALNKK